MKQQHQGSNTIGMSLHLGWMATTLAIPFLFSSTEAMGQRCQSQWLPGVGEPGGGANRPVRALTVMPNGNLIAGGDFTFIGGVNANHIARWDGAGWSTLGQGVAGSSDVFQVRTLLAMPNGDVVASGEFVRAGTVIANHIARWNGTTWSAMGTGLDRTALALAALSNGDVVAGGLFSTAGGVSVKNIARWNGASWSPLGAGIDLQVVALAVMPNGDLIAGGQITSAGGMPVRNVARWDGTDWSAMGTGLGNENGFIESFAVLPNGDLLAAGLIDASDGEELNYIARWDGVRWSQFGDRLNTLVSKMTLLPNGDLVAGGWFVSAGGVRVNYIARWDGTAWTAFGTGLNSGVYALVTLSNGDVAAGGTFTVAGGIPASFMARYAFGAQLRILKDPASVFACPAATSFSFEVFAAEAGGEGGGEIRYRWQFEAPPQGSEAWTDLPDGPFPPEAGSAAAASGSETDTLTITNADPAAALRYRAVVTNACGSIVSSAASLTYCPGDYNCDGGIDGSDVQAFFADWETGSAAADLNADGGVDGEDVEFFFLRWENGC